MTDRRLALAFIVVFGFIGVLALGGLYMSYTTQGQAIEACLELAKTGQELPGFCDQIGGKK